MKKLAIIAAVALAAAACSPAEQEAEAPPPPPQGLMEQADALDEGHAAVLATQVLAQKTDLDPPCVAVRDVQRKGVVPADVAPDSVYAPYVGALTFSVQCGERITTVRARPQDRWLVVMRPGAETAEFANCASENGRADLCYGDIPRAAAPAAEEAPPAP